MLLRHISALVDWWNQEERAPSAAEKLEGLAFSIMVALDGYAGALPRFIITTSPHESDKEYNQTNGNNWWPVGADIGPLHEHWHSVRKQQGQR
jgi:hypothetical protein